MSEGLNILAGAPKQGKSILALNLALTIAGGGKALGNVAVPPGGVLYLSLEDRQRRVKSRAVKMLREIDPSLAAGIRRRLTVATDWPRIDEGGLRLLDVWHGRAERPALVIIDVWNRVVPQPDGRRGSAYYEESEQWARVKDYSDRRGLAVLVVHHTRKPGPNQDEQDYVMAISGSIGVSGTADGLLVLLRTRHEREARLHVTGRDVGEQELVLTFEPDTLTWRSAGTAAEHLAGHVQKAIVTYLRGLGPRGAAFPREIADATEMKLNSVVQALHRMHRDKLIRKTGNAYAWPGEGWVDPDVAAL
jgi:hypothetical protein